MPPTSSVRHIFADIDFDDDFDVPDAVLEKLQSSLKSAGVDTRSVLQSFSPVADANQAQVIHARDHTIRIVAPAGSGKTQTMVNRVLGRVKEGLAPQRILMLTFDNAAAGSLKEKLQSTLGENSASVAGIRISTLNAFGFWIVREHLRDEPRDVVERGQQFGFVRTVLDELHAVSPDRHDLLMQGVQRSFLLNFFSLLKNEAFDPKPKPRWDLHGGVAGGGHQRLERECQPVTAGGVGNDA